MEMSRSQECKENKRAPTNRKHGCKSNFDIDIYIDLSGENVIVSDNNQFVLINPGSIP